MSPMPSVVVNKGGFFTAIAKGFFGLLITSVLCATGVGVVALRMVDSKFSDVRELGQAMVSGLPRLRESLPPVLADAINDRRAGEYGENVQVSVTLVDSKRRDRQRAVIEVKNTGHETISLLAMNIRLEDAKGIPVRTFVSYAATPLAIEDEWRGPIMPGATRKFVHEIPVSEFDLTATAEIADLRVTRTDSPTSTELAAPAESKHADHERELAGKDD